MTNLNSEQTNIEQNKVSRSSLTVRKGGNFYFDVREHQIRCWFSSFSGLEKIFVNEKLVLVSRRRPWFKLLNEHHITLDGESYTIKIGAHSWREPFRGILIAELYRGQQLIDQDEINLNSDSNCDVDIKRNFSWKAFFKDLIPYMIIGGVVGFLVGILSG